MFVDIGAYPLMVDVVMGNFQRLYSETGQKFYKKNMNLPQPQTLISDGEPLPCVFIGDKAFQLTYFFTSALL